MMLFMEENPLLKKISILFEDRDVVVIDKPAGLLVHPDGKTKEQTLCDWISALYPETKGVGEPLTLSSGEVIDRPGIVHRIDRETSGILLVARNQKSFLFFKKQFQGHSVRKTYNAFVYGVLKEKTGTINMPIGRSKGDFRQYTSPERARGIMREALTHYIYKGGNSDFSFVELSPKTGRTHQLRVHMKFLGNPIVCDRLYAKQMSCALGFNRVALHARGLAFSALNGERIALEAPLPGDFTEALKELNLPESVAKPVSLW